VKNMSAFFIPTLAWAAILLLLILAAVTDLKDRIIPNEIVVAIASIGVAMGLILQPELLWQRLLTAFAVFCVLGIFSHYRIIGGGDLKLISAVSLLVPPDRVGLLLIEIALAGGVLSCIYIASQHAVRKRGAPLAARDVASPRSGLAGMLERERARISAGDSLPYALAVLGGVSFYTARGFAQCSYAMSCSL
jgi:prepilin peptidase CpaA